MKKVAVYYGKKAIVSNPQELKTFIFESGFEYPEKHYVAKLVNEFVFDADSRLNVEHGNDIHIMPPGIGNGQIHVYPALAETIEEHDRIFKERLDAEKAKAEKEKHEYEQQRLGELYKQQRGWYVCEVEYAIDDLFRGGHKWKTMFGRVLADSAADAYMKACKKIEEKNGYWVQEMINADIEYIGVLTDEKIDEYGI